MEGGLLFLLCQTALCQWEQNRPQTAEPNNFWECARLTVWIQTPFTVAWFYFWIHSLGKVEERNFSLHCSFISFIPAGIDYKLNIPAFWKHMRQKSAARSCRTSPIDCLPLTATLSLLYEPVLLKAFKSCSCCLLHSAQVSPRVSIRCLERSRSHGGRRGEEVVIRKWD